MLYAHQLWLIAGRLECGTESSGPRHISTSGYVALSHDNAINACNSMSLRVRMLCDGGRRIQEHRIVGVTSQSAKQEDDVDDECRVWRLVANFRSSVGNERVSG